MDAATSLVSEPMEPTKGQGREAFEPESEWIVLAGAASLVVIGLVGAGRT
jgi:hypothetical protein